jgi:hypothetical protein
MQSYAIICGSGMGSGSAPQSARGPVEEALEGLIESANAAKTSGKRNFGHWHSCFMNELFGEKNSSGLGY